MSAPVVIYSRNSAKWIAGLLAQKGKLDLHEVWEDGVRNLAPKVAYFRIGEDFGSPVAGEALELERRYRAVGARIVNPPSAKFLSSRKDDAYLLLSAAGIKAPFRIASPRLGDIMAALAVGKLKYPFVLRTVDGMNGNLTDIVRGEKQVEDTLAKHSIRGPRFMACEFISSQTKDGYHAKWRAYVFGEKIDMWEGGIARRWIVNLADNQDFEPKDFQKFGEIGNWPHRFTALVLKAARALALDVVAFDVLLDGTICDVNDTYGMTLDKLPGDLVPQNLRKYRAGHYGRLGDWLCSLAGVA